MIGRLLAWLRGGRSGGDADEGTLWDVMPDWTYGSGGRLHGAGIARDEQEDAVADVAEEGERLSRVDDR